MELREIKQLARMLRAGLMTTDVVSKVGCFRETIDNFGIGLTQLVVSRTALDPVVLVQQR